MAASLAEGRRQALATVRELIEALAEAAGDLPEGLDTAVQIGVCDG